MWTRGQLKERAKQTLRISYWKAFLVSIVLAIVGGGIPSCSFRSNFHWQSGNGATLNLPDIGENELSGLLAVAVIAIIIIAVLVALVAIAFRIFIYAPLEVGVRQFFKQAALQDVNMNYMGYSFSQGRYMPVVKATLLRTVLNILWFLLFIIPGIVKAYAYSMVPYILSDNPGIGTKRAVELSNLMTRGQKWRMFVLDLSFIGWYLLGAIACGVGILFVQPYVNATKAELYLVLRDNALNEGICKNEELNII